MVNKIRPVFIDNSSRLPLLNDNGRTFVGLENSTSPELVERVINLFEYLNEHLGFNNSAEGRENQKCFNLLLGSIYPEVMIDLADLIYAQHERLAVYLSFDHINIILKKHFDLNGDSLEKINQRMTQIFYRLATTIAESHYLKEDSKVICLFSESYSYYLYQTKNFPWEDLPQPRFLNLGHPVLDVATGLAGFSKIYSWPENYPQLILSDSDRFIVNGLSHFLQLTGKKNVILLEADYPTKPPQGMKFGFIVVNKFLHHLQRDDRVNFLKWSRGVLEEYGVLEILDTDLENYIIEQSNQPDFKNKLTAGYFKTLVGVESGYTNNLKFDIQDAGFRITHFDCKEYCDETDAFSQKPGETISLNFKGVEIIAEKLV
jgi:hypothetical protein